MLAEATLPTVRFEVPVQPRVTNQRSSAPKFASEAQPESVPAHAHEAGIQPELVPVPASVFDDDFFRADNHLAGEQEDDLLEEGAQAHRAGEIRVQQVEKWGATVSTPVDEPAVRAASYGGAVAADVVRDEPDELDIPAFLRRGN